VVVGFPLKLELFSTLQGFFSELVCLNSAHRLLFQDFNINPNHERSMGLRVGGVAACFGCPQGIASTPLPPAAHHVYLKPVTTPLFQKDARPRAVTWRLTILFWRGGGWEGRGCGPSAGIPISPRRSIVQGRREHSHPPSHATKAPGRGSRG